MGQGLPREMGESPSLVIIPCTDVALHEQELNQAILSLCHHRDRMNSGDATLIVFKLL